MALSVREFVPMRSIRIRAFADETPIDESLQLSLLSGRKSIEISTGAVQRVPCAAFGIHIPGCSAPGDGDWEPSQIDIPKGDGVFDVKLNVRRPVRMVSVHVRFLNPDSAEPVWFSMRGNNGYSMGVLPRRKNVFDLALPYGKVQFMATTDDHGRVTREWEVNGDSPQRVELVIR